MSLPLSSDRTLTWETHIGGDPLSTPRQYANLLYMLGIYISVDVYNLHIDPYPTPQTPSNSRPITSLPTEIQDQILKCLPWQAQALCMLVCKKWREILLGQVAIESRYTVYYEPRMHYMWNQQARMIKFNICKGQLTELYFKIDNSKSFFYSSESYVEQSIWSINFADHPIINDPVFFCDPDGRFPAVGERVNDWGERQQVDHTQRIVRIDLNATVVHAETRKFISITYASCNIDKFKAESKWTLPWRTLNQPGIEWEFGRPSGITHRRLFESAAGVVASIRDEWDSGEFCVRKMNIEEDWTDYVNQLRARGEQLQGTPNRTNNAVLKLEVEYGAMVA